MQEHNAIDQAIVNFVEQFKQTRDADTAFDYLVREGLPQWIVHRVSLLVPTAFARLVFGDFPLSSMFTQVRADGSIQERPLMSDRVFARATALGPAQLESDKQVVIDLAVTSAEIQAINHALNQGSAARKPKRTPPNWCPTQTPRPK